VNGRRLTIQWCSRAAVPNPALRASGSAGASASRRLLRAPSESSFSRSNRRAASPAPHVGRAQHAGKTLAGPKYDLEVTDNRMMWVRIAEGLKASGIFQTVDAEFASETRIFGALEYENVFSVAPTTFRPDTSGLWKYTLRLSYPESQEPNAEPTKDGYVFREGPLGELLAAMAFCLECRIFLVSTVDSLPGSNFGHLKTEYNVYRGLTGPTIDPVAFSSVERNFAKGMAEFFDLLRSIHPRHHFAVANALNHYARALREIGVDDEMVFIRLVSAIEAVAEAVDVSRDSLAQRALAAITTTSELTSHEREEISKLLRTRKVKQRFIEFLVTHSVDFLDGEANSSSHTLVSHKSLPEVVAAIYDARSAYLHSGDPMYLSRYWPENPTWQTGSTVGMIWQSRRYSAKQKLPYAHFFHRLVRHCILAHLRILPKVAAKAG
jgi:hypothetical protein